MDMPAMLSEQLYVCPAALSPHLKNPSPPPPLPLLHHDTRLAAKADEEDSDAEDTELPLTAEERDQQQQALEKHKEECDKVGTAVRARVCIHICVRQGPGWLTWSVRCGTAS